MSQERLLYKALTVGQRIVSHAFKNQQGTIVRVGLPSGSEPDWYQVRFDNFPDVVRDCHRETFKPLRTQDRHRRLVKVKP